MASDPASGPTAGSANLKVAQLAPEGVESDEESDVEFDFDIGADVIGDEDDGEDEDADEGDIGISWTSSSATTKTQAPQQDDPGLARILEKKRVGDEKESKSQQEKADAATAASSSTKERKKEKKRRQRSRIELEHRLDLLCQLSRAMRVNKVCDADMLWKLANVQMPAPFRTMDTVKRVRVFVGWYHDTFGIDDSCQDSELISSDRLAHVLRERLGSRLELTLVFIALARSVGIPCRLVANLHPRGRLVATQTKKKTADGKQPVPTSEEVTLVSIRQAKRTPSRPNEYWAEILVLPSGNALGKPRSAKKTGKGKRRKVENLVDNDDNNDDDDDDDDDDDEAGDDGSDGANESEIIKAKRVTPEVVELGPAAHGSWISVFPADRDIGTLGHLPAESCYVVGMLSEGFAVDVTRRYARRWSSTSKFRHNEKDGWWQFGVLLGMQQRGRTWVESAKTKLTAAQRQAFRKAVSMEVVANEEEELQKRAEHESLPTSVEAFRRHSSYVLLKHLRRYEAIKPGVQPTSFFKGMEVHLRENVATLRSKTGWRCKGRVIREDERGNPYKLVDPIRRGGLDHASIATFDVSESTSDAKPYVASQLNPSSDDAFPSLHESHDKSARASENDADDGVEDMDAFEEDGEDADGATDPEAGKIRLFGEWQTDEFVPPPLGPNGEIPKNQYGNVEMWSPKHCPQGCEHVQVDLAAQAAKGLGIDFAPAMVGFEHRDFRMLPKYEGVIVAAHHAQTVRDAAEELQQARIEKAAQKRRERVLKRWETLTKAVLVKAELAQRYNSSAPASNDPDTGDNTNDAIEVQLRGHTQACEHEFVAKKRAKNEEDPAISGFHGTLFVCVRCGVRKREEVI